MLDVRAEQIVIPNGDQKYTLNDGPMTSSKRIPRSAGTYALLEILVTLLLFAVITIPILFWQNSKEYNSDTTTVRIRFLDTSHPPSSAIYYILPLSTHNAADHHVSIRWRISIHWCSRTVKSAPFQLIHVPSIYLRLPCSTILIWFLTRPQRPALACLVSCK